MNFKFNSNSYQYKVEEVYFFFIFEQIWCVCSLQKHWGANFTQKDFINAHLWWSQGRDDGSKTLTHNVHHRSASVSCDWNQTHVVIFLLQKVLHRNTWYPYHNMSTEGDVYGVGLCAEYSLKRKYYRDDYPLYYFLGYANMSLKIVPGVYVQ